MADFQISKQKQFNAWLDHMFWVRVRVMVLNATFNNISIISSRPVLLVEETGGHGENYRPAVDH
jgi:hypothetical protein